MNKTGKVITTDKFYRLVKKYAPRMLKMSNEEFESFKKGSKPFCSGPSYSLYSSSKLDGDPSSGHGARVLKSTDIYFGKVCFPPVEFYNRENIPGVSSEFYDDANWTGLILEHYAMPFLYGHMRLYFKVNGINSIEEAMELFNPDRIKARKRLFSR